MDELKKGAEFATYAEFMKSLNNFQAMTNSVFVIETSKKIETVNKHIKREENTYNVNFKYRYAKYICKQHSTFKYYQTSNLEPVQLCPVFVKVSAYKSRNCLVVLDSYLQHNHGSETIFRAPQLKRRSENPNLEKPQRKRKPNANSCLEAKEKSLQASIIPIDIMGPRKTTFADIHYDTQLSNSFSENDDQGNELLEPNEMQMIKEEDDIEYTADHYKNEMYDCATDSPHTSQNAEENILRRLDCMAESQTRFQQEVINVLKSEFTSLKMLLVKQHRESISLFNDFITVFGRNGSTKMSTNNYTE